MQSRLNQSSSLGVPWQGLFQADSVTQSTGPQAVHTHTEGASSNGGWQREIEGHVFVGKCSITQVDWTERVNTKRVGPMGALQQVAFVRENEHTNRRHTPPGYQAPSLAFCSFHLFFFFPFFSFTRSSSPAQASTAAHLFNRNQPHQRLSNQ